MTPSRQTRVHAAALAAFSLALYLPLIGKGFVLDDFGHVYVTQFESIRFGLLHSSGGPYYAPLAWVTFKLDWLLFGAQPFLWAATNLLIHVANTLLLYWLALRLWRSPAAAGWSALGFALLYPANADLMMFISTRAHFLVAFFYLAGMLSTLWLLSTTRYRLLAAVVVLVSAGAAIFAKESGFTVIAAIAVILLYERKAHGRRLGAASTVLLFAGLCAEFALYLFLRARSEAVPISFQGGPCCSYTLSLRVLGESLAFYAMNTYGLIFILGAAIAFYYFSLGDSRLLPDASTGYDVLFSVMLFASATAPYWLMPGRSRYGYVGGIGAALALGCSRSFTDGAQVQKLGSKLAALTPIALAITLSVAFTVKRAAEWNLMARANNSVLAQISALQPTVPPNTFIVLTYARPDAKNGFPEGLDFAFEYALHDLYRDPTVDGSLHLQGTPYPTGANAHELRLRYAAGPPPLVTKDEGMD